MRSLAAMSQERNTRKVEVRPPTSADAPEFTSAMLASRSLHEPWVSPPLDTDQFALWLARCEDGRCVHRLVTLDGRIAGFVTLSEIVRGAFQNAYLSYAAVAARAGEGTMSEGAALVIDEAFGSLGLHRLEANVQPANERSLALVRRLGFVREGFSERYLYVAGQWRDHERWALRAEQWIR